MGIDDDNDGTPDFDSAAQADRADTDDDGSVSGTEASAAGSDDRPGGVTGDPDTVAGAGADEALQAGASPEQLSAVTAKSGAISEREGAEIADTLQQGDRADSQPANARSKNGGKLDGGGRGSSSIQSRTGERFIRQAEAGASRRIVNGPQTQSTDTARISDPTEAEGQTERVLENRGEVRASVTRYGHRQLNRQAISTGTRDPTAGTTPGLVDRVLTADADPEIANDLTDSGGLLAEEGNSGTPVTNITGISEADLRKPSDPILPGVLPSRQQLRKGGAGETALFRSDAEDPTGTVPDREGVGERALEGAAVAGASILNVRERAADAEQIIEGVQALPREVREEGAGDVGETLTALGRREGVRTARRVKSDPVRASSGLALDVAGGAVVGGRVPDAGDLKAEVDPRIGMFGETIESKALGLRSDGSATDSGVDVDRSQTVGDQVAQLPTERPGGLDAQTVDEARGVSGPSTASLARGRLRRGASQVRDRVSDELDRLSVETRVGSGLGSVEVRRESQGPELTENRVTPNLYQQSVTDQQRRTRQAQEGGDFEGAPSPFGNDGATFDPTADADARRRAAERRFAEQDSGPDLDGDGRRAVAPDVRGGVAGGLLAGAFGRAKQAQESSVTTDVTNFAGPTPDNRVDVTTGVDTVGDVRGGVDLDQRVDTRLDQNTRIDVGQDIRQDLNTQQEIDTQRDLNTKRDFGSDFDPDNDPDPNFDFNIDTDVDPRPGPRPKPDDTVGFGVGVGFDEEEFKNRVATPAQFFFL